MTAAPDGRGDGHPSDELSALLDDELSRHEAAAVREHLRGCAACRRELAALQQARSALRSLGRLEMPSEVTDRFAARLRRIARITAIAAGSGAAVTAALLWLDPAARPVSPPAVSLLVASTASVAAATRPIDRQDVPAPDDVPSQLDSLTLVGIYQDGLMVRAVYGNGTDQLEVWQEPGRLDTSPSMTRVTLGGHPGYLYRIGADSAFAWQNGSVVVTAVGDAPSVAAAAASMGPPPSGGGPLGRLRQVCRQVVEDLTGSR